MDVNFMQAAPDPSSDPMAFLQQRQMAQLLMKQGMQGPQGSTVGGQYAPPGAMAYGAQLANSLAGGYKGQQLQDAQRAATALNGGTPQPTNFQRASNFLGGLGGTP